MTGIFVAPIVEGHGEVQAVPVLLHRLAAAARGRPALRVNPPIRVKAGSFFNDAEYFHRYVSLATGKAASHANGHVLILLDCEDECAAERGPELLQRAIAVRSDIGITVALAVREYESWFLAAARSLAGIAGLDAAAAPPPQSERLRDAKGWLSKRMQQPYNPPIHQPEFTRAFSFAEASAAPSFTRLRERMIAVFSE